MARGENPAEDERQKRIQDREAVRAATVQHLTDRYLREHAETRKKPSSAVGDRILLKNHILPELGRYRVTEVSRAQVAKLHHEMREIPTQANRALALISKMMMLAERWGLRPDGSNPARGLERYRERKRERYLSVSELERLGTVLLEVERDGSEPLAALAALRLLILTGCRRGEILNLTWPEVDLERACLRLGESKTGPKVLPLSAPAVALLVELQAKRDRSPWVIPGARGGKPLVGLHRIWERIRNRADLPDVRVHDLRHSFAATGVGIGAGLPILGRLLGHKTPLTTARYAHVADNPAREIAERIGARIAATLSGHPKAPVIPISRGSAAG